MKVVMPVAGKGTRLRPHTHLVPKPLLKVAGRPVMDWVMDRLEGLDITELIFITGHLKEQVEAFARNHYRIPSRYIEQQVQDGTAGAVNLARPYVDQPVLIVFVASLLYGLVFLFLLRTHQLPVDWLGTLRETVIPTAIVNTAVAPLAYAVLVRLERRTRSTVAVDW